MKKQTLLMGLVVALFLCNMVNCIDRVNISVAAPVMMKEYGWSTTTLGIVFSSFFWGYCIFQIPFGWLSDRIGGRHVLTGSATAWALFTFLTPFSSNVSILSAIRTGLGISEAAIFPAQTAYISKYLPRNLIGRIQAFNLSASALGPLVATPLAVFCMAQWGWRSMFYIFAGITVAWIILWVWITNRAETKDGQEALASAQAQSTTDKKEASEAIFEKPFSKLEVWGSSMAWYSNAYVFFFFLMWLPTYFVQARNMSLEQMAGYTMIPWLALFCMMNFAGWVADTIKRKCVHHVFWRRMLYSGAFVWSSFWLFQLQDVQSGVEAVIYMSVALAGQAFTWPVAYSLPIEYNPQKAGILTGLVTGCGTVAGILGPIITGYVIQGGQWNQAFLATAFFALTGAALVALTSRYSTGVKKETVEISIGK
jgi:MFS family permease